MHSPSPSDRPQLNDILAGPVQELMITLQNYNRILTQLYRVNNFLKPALAELHTTDNLVEYNCFVYKTYEQDVTHRCSVRIYVKLHKTDTFRVLAPLMEKIEQLAEADDWKTSTISGTPGRCYHLENLPGLFTYSITAMLPIEGTDNCKIIKKTKTYTPRAYELDEFQLVCEVPKI